MAGQEEVMRLVAELQECERPDHAERGSIVQLARPRLLICLIDLPRWRRDGFLRAVAASLDCEASDDAVLFAAGVAVRFQHSDDVR